MNTREIELVLPRKTVRVPFERKYTDVTMPRKHIKVVLKADPR